jgi:hypothetical protein
LVAEQKAGTTQGAAHDCASWESGGWVVEDKPNFTKQLFVVQALCNGVTIAGVLLTLLTAKWWFLAGVGLVATVAAQLKLYQASTRDTLHEFSDERSPAFVNFFEEWYDRNGNHDIYCKDLDWLDRSELEPIVAVLIRRRAQVSIFLREEGASVCQRLRDAGVHLYHVPEVARSEMKMSLKSDNDDKELIIRRKTPGSTTVRFIRSEDKYRLGLAEDLFTLYKLRHNTGTSDPSAGQ